MYEKESTPRTIHMHGFENGKWHEVGAAIHDGSVAAVARGVMGQIRSHGHTVTEHGGNFTGEAGAPVVLWFDVEIESSPDFPKQWHVFSESGDVWPGSDTPPRRVAAFAPKKRGASK